MALQGAAVQSATAWCFVTGPSSYEVLYSSPGQIRVRYALTPALAVKKIRELVASFNLLSDVSALVREFVLNPLSAQVAFLRSHDLARRSEAWLAGHLRYLGCNYILGSASDF